LFRDQDPERATYAAMVWAMDRAIGRVVQRLKELGQYDHTLIVFLSDNGGSPVNDSNNDPLKGFKGNKFEGGHRVPFVVHWPAAVAGGSRFNGLSSSLDLFPTFLAAAGIPQPADLPLDGVNLLPYLQAQA
ncbi:sulfatase-like hydrolase/transferase, partial [Arthrospira platensis SPKY1]|nr:sulfatase-like hydrolase/transferase [Arthrospira platensis SPKY1]